PFDIDAVLVGAGEQGHVLSSQSVVPSNSVGNDGRVRVPDVWHVVGIVERARDVHVGLRTTDRGRTKSPHTASSQSGTVDATALAVGNQCRQTSAAHRHGYATGQACHAGATIARASAGASNPRNHTQKSPVESK